MYRPVLQDTTKTNQDHYNFPLFPSLSYTQPTHTSNTTTKNLAVQLTDPSSWENASQHHVLDPTVLPSQETGQDIDWASFQVEDLAIFLRQAPSPSDTAEPNLSSQLPLLPPTEIPAPIPSQNDSPSIGLASGFHETREPLSHAARHPELPTQPSIPRRFVKKQTEEQKSARKINTELNRKKNIELAEAVEALQVKVDQELETIAVEHNKKVEYVRALMHYGSSKRHRRRPTIMQAAVHMLSQKYNQETYHRYNLKELQQMVKTEPWRIWGVDEEKEGYVHISLDELEEDEEDDDDLAAEKARRRELNDTMVRECIEFRDRKEKGARLNHRSAAQDVENTKSELQVMCENLYQRTGAISIGFVSRGSANCTSRPGFFVGGPAGEFCSMDLGKNPFDVCLLLESWAIRREMSVASFKAPQKRTECTRMILSGLRLVSRDPKAVMHYKNYIPDVVLKHHVQLSNWPNGVPFEAPSELNSILSVDTLLEALMSGTCKWVNITKRQAEEIAEEEKKKGKPLKAVRAKRSDAGGTHKKVGTKRKRAKAREDDDRRVRGRTSGSDDESDARM